VGSGPAPFLIENNAQLRLDLQILKGWPHVRPGMAVHVEQDGRSATGALLSLASTIDPATRALAAKASLPTDTGLILAKA
jgi:cobalt-zinc-cadmium efflux system membrane fusion protein